MRILRLLRVLRGLPVGGGHHDQLVHALERPFARDQFRGEPIEQLRMRRRATLEAEVVRRAHDALPEVMQPQAVDHYTRGERMIGAGDPLRKLQSAPGGLAVGRRRREFFLQRGDGGQSGRLNHLAGLVSFALDQQADGRGGAAFVRPAKHIHAQLRLVRSAEIRLPDIARPKNAGRAVVVNLADRIEFVIVAARAFDGQADEGGGGCVHHVLKARVKIVGRVVGFIVPRAGADHSGSNDRLLVAIGHLVAGQLIGHEPVVRHVVVEGVDHPVAIPPNVWLQLIALVAARLSEADEVEPVPRPAFAVMLGSEQFINQLLVSLRVFVIDESLHLSGGRRQAQQVKVRAANERAFVGQWRGLELALFQLG